MERAWSSSGATLVGFLNQIKSKCKSRQMSNHFSSSKNEGHIKKNILGRGPIFETPLRQPHLAFSVFSPCKWIVF